MTTGLVSLFLSTALASPPLVDHYCGRTEWIDPKSGRAVASFEVCLKIEKVPEKDLIVQSSYRELYGANEDIIAGTTILEGRGGSRFVETGHEAGRKVRGEYVMTGSAWNWSGWSATRRFESGNVQRILARRDGTSVDIESEMISPFGLALASMRGHYGRVSPIDFDRRVRGMKPRKR